jgi:hypothetical protein
MVLGREIQAMNSKANYNEELAGRVRLSLKQRRPEFSKLSVWEDTPCGLRQCEQLLCEANHCEEKANHAKNSLSLMAVANT